MFDNQYIKFCGMGYFTSEDRWIHPERIEKTHEIIYTAKGTVHIEDGGVRHSLERGSMIILPAGVMHRGFKESCKTEFYWIHFLKDDSLQLPYITESFESPHIFRELLHYANLPEADDFIISSVFAYLISQIYICRPESQAPSKLASEIAEWTRINAGAALTVEETAGHFGYNAEYISRVFKKNYNIGLKEYQQNILLKKAKDYLTNTNYSIKEIAAILNFRDANLFTNFFKYHENTVPLRYRNAYTKTHMNKK